MPLFRLTSDDGEDLGELELSSPTPGDRISIGRDTVVVTDVVDGTTDGPEVVVRYEVRVQDLAGPGIESALKGQTNKEASVFEDPNTGLVQQVWVTFSDPAVLELEAAIENGEPVLRARLHRRWSDDSPL